MGQLKAKYLGSSAVEGRHLTSDAKQVVLESKILGVRIAWLNQVVSQSYSYVEFSGLDLVSRSGQNTTEFDGSEVGIYVGGIAVGDGFAAANSPRRVLVRQTGTDEGVKDAFGNEIHGEITFTNSMYKVSFQDSTGAPFTFSSAQNVDLFIPEYVNLHQMNPIDLLTMSGVGGVIDATSASLLTQFIEDMVSTAEGEGASLVGVEANSLDNLSGITAQEVFESIDDFVGSLGSEIVGEGASLVAIEDSSALFTSTTVEGALAEAMTAAGVAQGDATQALADAATAAGAVSTLTSDLASNDLNKGASLVGINDAQNMFTSTTVEGALFEVMDLAVAVDGNATQALADAATAQAAAEAAQGDATQALADAATAQAAAEAAQSAVDALALYIPTSHRYVLLEGDALYGEVGVVIGLNKSLTSIDSTWIIMPGATVQSYQDDFDIVGIVPGEEAVEGSFTVKWKFANGEAVKAGWKYKVLVADEVNFPGYSVGDIYEPLSNENLSCGTAILGLGLADNSPEENEVMRIHFVKV